LDRVLSFLTSRKMLTLLIVINLSGAIYGFYWYWGQLSATPVKFWPVVPDSPTAVVLFSVFLFLLLKHGLSRSIKNEQPMNGIISDYISPLAIAWVVKYGVWAVIINISYYLIAGEYSFENFHLTLSHAGMALEGFVFFRVLRLTLGQALVTTALMSLSDYFDYALKLYPYLFTPLQYPVASLSAQALTLVISLWFISAALQRRKR
jgi:uncharacterized membrane protein YpjA